MMVFPSLNYYPQKPSFKSSYQTPLKGQYKSSFPNLSLPKRKPSLEPPPYSPRDDLEIRYQSQAKSLHWLRIANASATLVISSAIVGFTALSLHQYSQSKSGSSWFVQRWLYNLDNRPTNAALGCGVLILIASLAYLMAALSPMVSLNEKPTKKFFISYVNMTI